MIKPFCGTTLWDIACSKLEKINIPIGQKWVSIYEQELKDISSKYKINKYFRSEESALSNNSISKIWEICENVPYEYYIMFNPCLPLLSLQTIERFIDTFINNNYNSLFGVVPIRDYFWGENEKLFFPSGVDILNTKDCPLLYKAAHCLYAGRTEDLRNNIQLGDFSKNNPALFIINNKIEILDIDDYHDWEIAESVYLRRIKK